MAPSHGCASLCQVSLLLVWGARSDRSCVAVHGAGWCRGVDERICFVYAVVVIVVIVVVVVIVVAVVVVAVVVVIFGVSIMAQV